MEHHSVKRRRLIEFSWRRAASVDAAEYGLSVSYETVRCSSKDVQRPLRKAAQGRALQAGRMVTLTQSLAMK